MLAMSVFFAIKEATPLTANYKKVPVITVPATFEKILLSIKKLKNIV
jgi:xanthine dehydrogenase molybdopterin-binding subunit B